MKKILSILAVVAMALSFASCNPNNPENKDFTITVDNITATSAYVKVEPKDTTAYYYWGVFDAVDLVQKDGKEYPQDSIVTWINEELQYLIALYKAYYGKDFEIKDFLYQGVSDYDFQDVLTPETDYVVCAIKFNEAGQAFGDVAKKRFSTSKMETKQASLSLSGLYAAELEDGYYELEAWDATEKYDIYLSPDVNKLDDDLTMANFYEPDYLFFSENGTEYTILDLNLKASLSGSTLNLNGTILVSNSYEYTVSITAEPEGDGAPARNIRGKKAAKTTVFSPKKCEMMK